MEEHGDRSQHRHRPIELGLIRVGSRSPGKSCRFATNQEGAPRRSRRSYRSDDVAPGGTDGRRACCADPCRGAGDLFRQSPRDRSAGRRRPGVPGAHADADDVERRHRRGRASAVARALGAGRRSDAEALVWHAIVLACLLGLAFTAAAVAGGPALYRAIGGEGKSSRRR